MFCLFDHLFILLYFLHYSNKKNLMNTGGNYINCHENNAKQCREFADHSDFLHYVTLLSIYMTIK